MNNGRRWLLPFSLLFSAVIMSVVSALISWPSAATTEEFRSALSVSRSLEQLRRNPPAVLDRQETLNRLLAERSKRAGPVDKADALLSRISYLCGKYRIALESMEPGHAVPAPMGMVEIPLKLVLSGKYRNLVRCWSAICSDEAGIVPTGFLLTPVEKGRSSASEVIQAEISFRVFWTGGRSE